MYAMVVDDVLAFDDENAAFPQHSRSALNGPNIVVG